MKDRLESEIKRLREKQTELETEGAALMRRREEILKTLFDIQGRHNQCVDLLKELETEVEVVDAVSGTNS